MHELFNKPRGKKQPRTRQELKYDHKVGEILKKKLKLWNYKPSDRYRSGIPDRYIVGGRWIEFKYVHHALKRNVGTLREFSAAQRTTIEELIEHGDEVWVFILFDTPEGLRVYMRGWREYKINASFTPTRLMTETAPWEMVEQMLRYHYDN